MTTYLNNLTMLNSLHGYFKSLTKVGSVSDGTVRRLLWLLFINEILNGDFNWFVSDDDYLTIRQFLSKMSLSCLMPYRAACADRIRIGSPKPTRGYYRQTEEQAVRDSEGGAPRITENLTTINTD